MADEERREGLVSWIWDEVSGFFVAMFDKVWSGFVDMVKPVFNTSYEYIEESGFFATPEAWENMVNYFKSTGVIDDVAARNLLNLQEAPGLTGTFMYYFTQHQLLMTYLNQTSYAMSSTLRHKLNSEYSPEIPYVSELIRAAFIAPEKTAEVRESLKKTGYGDDDINLMFLASYALYDPNLVRSLYLRGELSIDQVYMRLREHGYTDTRIAEMIRDWPAIPGIGDIITLSYRGAFSEENRRAWPWAFDVPGEVVQWLEKQGLSRDWAERYWYSHWQQPGVREMFEMMHRGALEESELDHTLKVSGYSKYWIEKLKTITYQPYTRVDVRRMHELGVIGDQELVQSYMDLGYDRDKAVKMAQFTVKYNLESERTLTRTQVESAYLENLMPYEQALKELELMGYSQERAEYLLALAEYNETKEIQESAVNNVKDRYVNRLVTKEEARTKLSNLNIDGRRIEVLIDKWSIDLYEDRKIPSKTDLDKFLRNGVIDEDRYRREMNKLGYNFEYVQWYETLVKKKKAG